MSLSLSQAAAIVEVALRKGRETNCAPLAVAVLDAGGHLKCFAREDGAGIAVSQRQGMHRRAELQRARRRFEPLRVHGSDQGGPRAVVKLQAIVIVPPRIFPQHAQAGHIEIRQLRQLRCELFGQRAGEVAALG